MALTDDRGVAPGGYERQPPQDLAAEQSVLGGMMLSKDAIADVVEVLSPGDFYRPAHQAVYDCVLDLYGRGEPADPITVSAELERRGELGRVGGAPYLHTLIATVPTAANASYYAEIVSEKSVLRRLVEAGTRIVQLGYNGAEGAEIDEVVDRAQASIYEVTERRMSEDYVSLEELLQPTMDEIDAIASRGGSSLGIPTGFADLDEVTNGLHPGQMIIVAARPGVGKALALDTPLPTPSGWTTMGEVSVGDQLIGANGRPITIVAATEIMHSRPCYEVEFSDGTVITADAQHQWSTWDRKTRRAYDYANPASDTPYPDNWASWSAQRSSAQPYAPGEREQMRAWRSVGLTSAQIGQRIGRTADAVQQQWNRPEPTSKRVMPRTTIEIAETIKVGPENNHAVPATRALVCPEADLPIDPYVLGYLLGDGDTTGRGRVACEPRDREWLLEEFAAAGHPAFPRNDPGHFGVHGLRAAWSSLGLSAGKRVPAVYLRGSYSQRLALAQGLVDSDGCIDGHGAYRFTSTSRHLIDGFLELLSSLGCVPQVHHRHGRVRAGNIGADAWEVIVPTGLALARLPRKALAARRRWKREQAGRYIVAVRPVPSVPVRCVEVDASDHLYLASRAMIPTHNSTLGLDFVRSCSVRHSMTSVIFSLEMSRTEIVMRLLSAEAKIRLGDMRGGRMTDDDWTRLARRMSEISEAPLFVDDSPNMTMMEIRAKARRLKQRNDLKLIVVDYLQLMTSGKRVESRQQEVSEFSRQLKLLAKELEVPVIAISQLNRGPEQRTDKRPMLADLRESGSLEQDADMVILINRPDAWERDDPRAGEADLILAKHRAGPTSTITVAHQLHYSRFADLAEG